MGWVERIRNWCNRDAGDDYDDDYQFVPFEKDVPVLPSEVRFYGGDGTIHGTTHLDVVTYRGQVIEVWFRCQTLPFKQTKVLDKSEAALSKEFSMFMQPEIVGLFLADPVNPEQ